MYNGACIHYYSKRELTEGGKGFDFMLLNIVYCDEMYGGMRIVKGKMGLAGKRTGEVSYRSRNRCPEANGNFRHCADGKTFQRLRWGFSSHASTLPEN